MAVGTVRHRLAKGNFKMAPFCVGRSVLNHPFLIIMLLLLIFLHRYFPFLFSLLVAASPVLICTVVLLGTLLIHGKPNEHNVHYHEEMSYNNTLVTSKNGAENDTYSTDREGIFSKDIFAEVRKDIVDKGMRSASGVFGSGVRVGGDSIDRLNWEFHNVEFSKGGQIHKAEKSKSDYGFANFENFNYQMHSDQGYDKTSEVHEDGHDQFEFSPGQKQLDDEAVHQECSDCEFDGAEKSSFDALVAVVIPTTQETHPLLDSLDPLHVEAPHDDASLKFEFESLDSNQSSEDSGEEENDEAIVEDKILKEKDNGENITNSWMEIEKNQHLESLLTKTGDEDEDAMEDDEGTDDDEDAEEEEDEEGENTDGEKDVTTHLTMWTEEDEKNLRLVGNSELERDLRLENLLARRRVKRNFSMISERNLIDLDRTDHISFQVPNISTKRVNPFDTPHDTNQEHFNSIPPIPGSAPSVSVPRKNPFDSPCTSPRKVQNLTEDVSGEKSMEMHLNNNAAEFHVAGSSSSGYNHHLRNVLKTQYVEMNRKDAVFRRYDSFSTGYNFPEDDVRQSDFMETDRRDARLKRRETFVARSAFSNMLDPPQKLSFLKMKPVFVPEVDRDAVVDHSFSGRESSLDSESTVSSSESDSEDEQPSKDHKAHFEHQRGDEGIAEDDRASTHSDDSSSKSSEKNQDIHSLQDYLEEGIAGSSLEMNAEVNADQIFQKIKTSHENHDNASSSSNSSLISEVVHSSEKRGEDEDEIVKESVFSPEASSNVSDAITELPVYDSSPSGIEKITPFSSSPTHG